MIIFLPLNKNSLNRIFEATLKFLFGGGIFPLKNSGSRILSKSRQVMGDDADLLWSKACGHVPDTAYKQVMVV